MYTLEIPKPSKRRFWSGGLTVMSDGLIYTASDGALGISSWKENPGGFLKLLGLTRDSEWMMDVVRFKGYAPHRREKASW